MVGRAVGLYAVGIVCAALYARERTGQGRSIDVPMFEVMTQFVLGDHLFGHTFQPARSGFGYRTKPPLSGAIVFGDLNAPSGASRFGGSPRPSGLRIEKVALIPVAGRCET